MWWTPWRSAVFACAPPSSFGPSRRDQFRLVFAARQAPQGTSSTAAVTTSALADAAARSGSARPGSAATALRRARRRPAAAAPVCTPGVGGRTRMCAAHRRGEVADDLAERRRKHIDPAHDQHVVGAADAAHPRRGAAAGARRGPQLDVVTGAEPEQRRRLVPQMRKHELALGPVGQRHGRAALRIDQLGMDEAAAAEMHAASALRIRPTATPRCRRCPSPR